VANGVIEPPVADKSGFERRGCVEPGRLESFALDERGLELGLQLAQSSVVRGARRHLLVQLAFDLSLAVERSLEALDLLPRGAQERA